jgi:putative oxidoreductase
MQRLYSTFPNGVPGGGLLLLRFAGGLPLILHGAAVLQGTPGATAAGASLIGLVAGGLLIGGLWTPYAGVLQTLVEVWLGVRGGTLADTHLVRATLGLSLAALGPGAWSIDARLFGRKRIDV